MLTMEPLDAGAREYRALTFTPPLTTEALEITFDHGATWAPMVAGTLDTADIFTPGVGPARAVLVAGPVPTGNPAGTVVLAVKSHTFKVRLTANPEIVIRRGGILSVTAA